MTVYAEPEVKAVGDACVLVEFGDEICAEANGRVRGLDAALRAAAPAAVVETVPGYCTLLVEYDPLEAGYEEMARLVAGLARSAGEGPAAQGPVKQIAVRYGGEDGPDLDEVATLHGMRPEEVVALHSGTTYTVYMLGFAPGFPYMGSLPEVIVTPRLRTPRTSVPAGSVGIAGRQTGIYPLSTPGGWRILGRTGAALFDPYRERPALLEPGDRVRFVPVDRDSEGELSSTASSPLPLPGARPAFRVLAPGWLTTVQDLGRRGYQRLGVPQAGAMDPLALRAANLLAENQPGAAGLEITLGGLALEALDDTWVAVAGADLDAVIYWGGWGPWPVQPWTDAYLRRGSILEFRSRRDGCRAYLAVAGGLAEPVVMGSSSTYLAGRFGGHEGRALAAGDVLRAGSPRPGRAGLPRRTVPESRRPAYDRSPVVRVMRGPHDDHFEPAAVERLLSETYRMSATSDRMGLRMEGPALVRRPEAGEMVSQGAALGAIQAPPDGQPIVLMADRQTAGGYPVIATVARADIPLLAQCMPGDGSVRFRAVSVEEAQQAWRQAVSACAVEEALPGVLGLDEEATGWAR